MWVVHALLSGIGFGFGQFFYAKLSSKGWIAISYVGVVSFLVLLTYRLHQCVINKRSIGTFVNKYHSNWYNAERDLFKY
jgi:hypothetical protein